MTSFWELQRQKALKTQLRRSIHLCRCNLDYQMSHPNEAKSNPERKVMTKPHQEATDRITQQHTKIIRNASVPTVERPKRFNRIG